MELTATQPSNSFEEEIALLEVMFYLKDIGCDYISLRIYLQNFATY
jgi:hypothetical protein